MKISANELRIGNWLLDGNGNYYQFEVADFALLSTRPDTTECNPIPLTPEILTAAGFIKSADDRFYGHDFQPIYHIQSGYYGAVGMPLYFKMRYLHQLQNLYFALTGTELEVKQLNP